MVKENHQQKLETILFQYATPLYPSRILLDHPVVRDFL